MDGLPEPDPMESKHLFMSLILMAILGALLAPNGIRGVGPDGGEGTDVQSYSAPPPEGYVHRPLMESFTGLSCPSCMGSGPDDAPFTIHIWRAWKTLRRPSVPWYFTS